MTIREGYTDATKVPLPEERVKHIKIATELLATLGEWSNPLQVKVVSEANGEYELVFRIPDEWGCDHG